LIRYTNQPSLNSKGDLINSAESDEVLPNGFTYTEWHEHRIDWSKKLVVYYIDGIEVVQKTYRYGSSLVSLLISSVPSISSFIDMNLWSDGGVWSGNMTIGTAAYLDVEYIEMAYNVSGKASRLSKRATGCQVVCKVDNVTSIGTPEIASAEDIATANEAIASTAHKFTPGTFSLFILISAAIFLI
jgi:beta-glucanase (GH16 family)